jgi:APA family basic amino acid/polyamine antiporter
VPHHAELAVGLVVALLAATLELRGAIGFSSFGVLLYYAVANAAALTLTPAEGRPPRLVCLLGLAGCLVLAVTLPLSTSLSGVAVLLLGTLGYLALRRSRAARARP